MSLDLKEFRTKITVEADAVISSMAESSGLEKQEIARNILHDFAIKKINEFRLLDRHLEREGLSALTAARQGKRGQ